MDFGFIFSSAAGELFSPTTAAYALATLGLAVHFGYAGLWEPTASPSPP